MKWPWEKRGRRGGEDVIANPKWAMLVRCNHDKDRPVRIAVYGKLDDSGPIIRMDLTDRERTALIRALEKGKW